MKTWQSFETDFDGKGLCKCNSDKHTNAISKMHASHSLHSGLRQRNDKYDFKYSKSAHAFSTKAS